MKEQLEKIEALAKQELSSCTEIKALDDLRIKFLGKKGELTAILSDSSQTRCAQISRRLSLPSSAHSNPKRSPLSSRRKLSTLLSPANTLRSASSTRSQRSRMRSVRYLWVWALRSQTVPRSTTTTTFSRLSTSPLITRQEIIYPPPYTDLIGSGTRYGEPEAPDTHHLSRTCFPFGRC